MFLHRLSHFLILTLSFVVAAPSLGQQTVPANTGNNAHDMLAKLSPAERNRVLDRVLGSIDHGPCDVVASQFIRYRTGRDSTWRASCSDGRYFIFELMDGADWAVSVIECDGTARQRAQCRQ